MLLVWGPVVQWLVQRFRSERLRVRSRRSATFRTVGPCKKAVFACLATFTFTRPAERKKIFLRIAVSTMGRKLAGLLAGPEPVEARRGTQAGPAARGSWKILPDYRWISTTTGLASFATIMCVTISNTTSCLLYLQARRWRQDQSLLSSNSFLAEDCW